jgi:NAD(P)-dependent dehydrogenase (short-subunit alcohol dehydrogenase family)
MTTSTTQGLLPLPISFEVHVCARSIAKRAVVQELREQGVRVTLVRPAEINQRATAYIANHPEIWPLAEERARKIEKMEEARKAARRRARAAIARLG